MDNQSEPEHRAFTLPKPGKTIGFETNCGTHQFRGDAETERGVIGWLKTTDSAGEVSEQRICLPPGRLREAWPVIGRVIEDEGRQEPLELGKIGLGTLVVMSSEAETS